MKIDTETNRQSRDFLVKLAAKFIIYLDKEGLVGLKSALYLLSLAAIWGSSFLFMRLSVPTLGAAWMIELRIGLAALFLCLVAISLKKPLYLRLHWRHYLVLGLLSAALPFLCYGFAAQNLTASLMSIINAMTPIFGTAISAMYFRQKLARSKVIGLLLGFIGVAVIVGFDTELFTTDAWWSVLIVLGAPLCYGLSSTYTQVVKGVEPFSNASGTMLMGSLLVMPLLMFFSVPAAPTVVVSASVIILGVVCTGVAYLIFFKLLNDIGTSSTLTVTFLVPVFGVFWGVVFLDETVGWHTLAGTILVLAGTVKTTGFSLRYLAKQPLTETR